MAEMPAVMPTKRAVLERAAAFVEHHLATLRNRAISLDAGSPTMTEHERLVLDATESAFAAGMLRQMAADCGDQERMRTVR